MDIPKYKTFSEKSEHFNIIKIDTINHFNLVFESHKMLKGIYRGINSSSYKIFTSKQREFFAKSQNQDYLSLLKEDQSIQEYFKLANIPQTELTYYSLLQHYNMPTPLIDFTKNFSKALFFALDGIDVDTSLNEIDNYFSIFFISDSYLDLLNASELFKGAVEVNRDANKTFSGYEDYSEELILKHTEDLINSWNRDVFLLESHKSYSDLIEIKNNHRIIIQEGVFICNNLKGNSLKPLEESLKLFLKEESERSNYSSWDEMDLNRPDVQENIQKYEDYMDKVQISQKRLEENIITSYEINKELIKSIKSDFEIPSKELMYFDVGKILERYK